MEQLNPVGLTRNAVHQYFWNGAGPIPSATTILKVYDKSGPLVGWATRETAAAAVRNLTVLQAMVSESGPDNAAAWLRTMPGFQRDTAADLGSTVHGLVESLARGQEVSVPDDIAPFVAAFQRGEVEWRPTYLAAEEMVMSREHGYAGTLDAIVRIAGEVWLVDWKTGKYIYPETGLQLAAYGHADFMGRPGVVDVWPVPKIDRYGVLHIRPEGAEFHEFAVTDETFQTFLALKRVYDWKQENERTIIGEPMTRAEVKG